MSRSTVEPGMKNVVSAARKETIAVRPPTIDDGAAIWDLVRRSKPLDENSCYAYLLLCEHFSGTCVVAVLDGDIVGSLTAYIPPGKHNVVFVWQVAVDRRARGLGIARAMLDELFQRRACRNVRFLETTVSPENTASQALFRRWAARRGAACTEETLFSAAHFGGANHEDEILFRIGPIRTTEDTGISKQGNELRESTNGE